MRHSPGWGFEHNTSKLRPAAVEAVGKWETRSVFQGGSAAVFSTVPARRLCELLRSAIAQRRVRPALVVVLAPRFDRPSRFGQTAEPVFIKDLSKEGRKKSPIGRDTGAA
jgi:hypothetical protein